MQRLRLSGSETEDVQQVGVRIPPREAAFRRVFGQSSFGGLGGLDGPVWLYARGALQESIEEGRSFCMSGGFSSLLGPYERRTLQ